MTTPDARRHALLFKSYYFVAFIPWGIYGPYLPLFFQRSGRSDAEIGALLALPPLLMILSPPIWGAVADRLKDKKQVLLILLAASALVFPGFWYGQSFLVAMATMAVFAFFFTPSEPLGDAITMENLSSAGGDYGRIRLWGSLGYIFPLLLMGAILKPESGAGVGVQSLVSVFVLFIAFRLLTFAWATRLPRSEGIHVGRFDLRALRILAERPLVVLMACAFLSRLATQGLYVFFSIYLDKLHMGDNLKGYFLAIGVVSEVVVMYYAAGVMNRVSIKWLFAVSLVASAVRLFAFSFHLGFLTIALIAPLQGLSFAAFHVPAVTYVNRVSPPQLRASGQTLFAAVVSGLGGVVGAQVSGALAGHLGVLGLFRVMSLVVIVSLVAFVALFQPERTAAPDCVSGAASD
jgi:PPP family 3-phenylpropionic acid transporter